MQTVMLAIEGEDEERFFDIIDKKIQDSSIESYPKYIKFKEAFSKKNSKVSKGKGKDKDRSSGKNKKRKSEKSSEEDLIALIQQRNKERNDHLKDMELRYSKQPYLKRSYYLGLFNNKTAFVYLCMDIIFNLLVVSLSKLSKIEKT